MRNPKTYTLVKFIEHMENHVNMNRRDKVKIDFSELELVYNGELRTVYNYELGDKTYTVYIDNECKTIGVLFNGYDYDIGEINTIGREDTVTVVLNCDVQWYNQS